MKKGSGKHSKTQKQQATGAGKPAPASRIVSEKIMRDLDRVLEGREFADIDEANAFLATLTGQGPQEALLDDAPASAKWEAQDLAFDALEAKTAAAARKLARRALKKDPDCVDALVVLAQIDSKSSQEMIAALEKAVAAGERSLGKKFFAENKGDFWGLIETRPYMRARLQLAELLRAEDRCPEAIRHYEGLLELNPNDNQGARDILLGCYLAADDLAGARRLFRQYKNDYSVVFAWARALGRFLANDLNGAAKELKAARQRNRFVELYFGGQKKIPESTPDSYALGSEEEALICVELLAEAWATHKEAVFWLLDQMQTIEH